MTSYQSFAFKHLLPARSIRLAIVHLSNRSGNESLLLVVLFEKGPEIVICIRFLGFAKAASALVVLVLDGHHVFANPLPLVVDAHLKDIVTSH